MKVGDINEKVLVKSGLFTNEEIKFARVYLNLPSAGRKGSATKNWFSYLGVYKHEKLSNSVNEKIDRILSNSKRAGN